MTKPLKAYQISDGDESSEVLFVRDMRAARRIGASEYGLDPCDVIVDRAKVFDKYAPGPVPGLALIENGWWLECWGCGCKIDSDLIHSIEHHDRTGDDRWEDRQLEPVERGHALYCTAECRDAKDRHEAERAHWGYITAAWLAATLRHKIPEAELVEGVHVYANKYDGHWVTEDAVVSFAFPGVKIGPATFRYNKREGKAYVSIFGGDKEAWNWWWFSIRGAD